MRINYTTGDIAKMTGVAPRTVSMWFDKGLLKGWRVPGTSFAERRVPRNELIRFFKTHEIPLNGDLLCDPTQVLVVAGRKRVAELIREHMPVSDDFQYVTEADGFSAGLMVSSHIFSTIVVCTSIGKNDAIMMARRVLKIPDYKTSLLLAIASEDDNELETLYAAGYHHVYKLPFDPLEVATRIIAKVREWQQCELL